MHEYPSIFKEVIRVLRPGGMFLSCEWERGVTYHPGRPEASDPTLQPPASAAFYRVLNAALEDQGIRTVIKEIPNYIVHTEAFHGITSSLFHVPIGAWPEDATLRGVGEKFLESQSRYAENMVPFLLRVGCPREFVDRLVRDFIRELETKEGLVGTYRLVYGIRT